MAGGRDRRPRRESGMVVVPTRTTETTEGGRVTFSCNRGGRSVAKVCNCRIERVAGRRIPRRGQRIGGGVFQRGGLASRQVPRKVYRELLAAESRGGYMQSCVIGCVRRISAALGDSLKLPPDLHLLPSGWPDVFAWTWAARMSGTSKSRLYKSFGGRFSVGESWISPKTIQTRLPKLSRETSCWLAVRQSCSLLSFSQ